MKISQLPIGTQKIFQLGKIAISILKCKNINRILNSGKNIVPLSGMFFNRNASILADNIAVESTDRFHSVNVRRDHHRQIAGEFLAQSADLRINVNGSTHFSADFLGQIPALKRFAVSVFLPNFIDDGAIDFLFPERVAIFPVISGIVRSHEKLHPVTFRQFQEKIHQIQRRQIPQALTGQHLRWISHPSAKTAADQNYRVDSNRMHPLKICLPLFPAPILMRDIV